LRQKRDNVTDLQTQLNQLSRQSAGTVPAGRAPPVEIPKQRQSAAFQPHPVNITHASSAPNVPSYRDYREPVNNSYSACGANPGSPRRFVTNDNVPLAQQMSEELGQRHNLNDLRRMPQLNSQVEGLMGNLALLEPDTDYDFMAAAGTGANPQAGNLLKYGIHVPLTNLNIMVVLYFQF
jgi:hypothetical protein